MARDLDSLVQLQDTLNRAEAARKLLEGVPDSMQELHDEHQERFGAIQALRDQKTEAELERRAAESAAEDAQARFEKYQAQVSQITTQREYGSLLKEIDEARAEMTSQEEIALKAIEAGDSARTQEETLQADFAELDARYQEALKKWEAEKPAVAEELKRLEAEIEELKASIPANVMLHFRRLFERLDGQALAPIAMVEKGAKAISVWHCSNCNYRVRPQVVMDIRNNGSLNQCESCQRFLFWSDEGS